MPKAKLDNAYEILLDYGYIEPGVSDREYWEALKKATLDFAEDGNVKYFDIVRAEEKELRDKVVPKVKKKKITGAAFKKGTSQESVENIQANTEVTSLAIRKPTPDVTAKDITPVTEEEEPKQAEVKTSPVGEGLKNILNSIAGTTESIKNVLIGQQKADNEAAKDAAQDAEQSTRAGQEKKLESKVFEGVKKVGEAVVKPVQSIFEKIWGFLKKVLLADIVRRLFNWLSDDGNKKKIGSIFKFVQNFWPLLLTGFLLFGTGIGSLITGTVSAIAGFIPTLLGLIPGLVAFLASPIGLAVLGTAAVVGGGMWVANKIKGGDDKKIEGGGEEKSPNEDKTIGEGGKIDTGKFLNMPTPTENGEASQKFSNFNKGGSVPGQGNTDTVPAMLTPGEFVLTKEATEKYGTDTLESMNAAAASGKKETSGTGRLIGSTIGGFTGAAVGFFADSPVSPAADIALGIAGSAAGGEIGDNIERKLTGKGKNKGDSVTNATQSFRNGGLVQYLNNGGQAKGVVTDPKEKERIEAEMLKWVNKERVEFLGLPPLDKITYAEGVELTKAMGPEYYGKGIIETSDTQSNFDTMTKTTWKTKSRGAETIFQGSAGRLTEEDKQAYLDSKPNARLAQALHQQIEMDNLGADISASAKKSAGYNKGGLVQHFNKGGRVLSTSENATMQRGKVVSGNMSQSNAEKLKREIELEKAEDRAISIYGFNSPEYNEVQKQKLILSGTPAEAIYTDKNGEVKVRGYSTFDGQTTVFDGKNKKGKSGGGLGRILGGAADFLTGNLTDFDGKGGKTFGASRVLAGAADALTGNRFDFDKHGKPAQVAKSKPKHTEIAPPSTSFSGRGSKPKVTAINAGSVGNTIDATQKTSPPQVPHFTATLYRSNDKIKTLGIMV